MKRNLILVVTAWMLVAVSMAGQEKKQTDSGPQATANLQVTQCALKVSGMTCGGCAGAAILPVEVAHGLAQKIWAIPFLASLGEVSS